MEAQTDILSTTSLIQMDGQVFLGSSYGKKDSIIMTYFFGGAQRAFRNCGNFLLVIETCTRSDMFIPESPKICIPHHSRGLPLFRPPFFLVACIGDRWQCLTLWQLLKATPHTRCQNTGQNSLGEVFLKRNKAEPFPVLFFSPMVF